MHHPSQQQLQKQIKHYKIVSQYANTLDTVLKTELAVTDGPDSHHTSTGTLSNSGHSPVLRSAGQHARRCNLFQ